MLGQLGGLGQALTPEDYLRQIYCGLAPYKPAPTDNFDEQLLLLLPTTEGDTK